MFYLNVILQATDGGKITSIRTALEKMIPLSLKDEGCERYEIYHSSDEIGTFILVEQWASKLLWQKHLEGAAVRIYKEEVLPHVEREVHICQKLTEPAPKPKK